MANTRQLKNDVATIADRATTVAEDIKDLGTAAKRTLADSADAVRETANEYLEQGRAKAREAGERVQQQVGEKPMTAVLLAAGLGFVLGMLWVRR
jgi:ElaB/YqjD/DUF883 family membrane-anchored ribosome-binding protein